MLGPTENLVKSLDYAIAYAAMGWCVLPLDGKRPTLTAWQHNASRDPATIRSWWRKSPSANVGVQLGPRSGIIDIETDTPEAAVALNELFRGDFPVTCMFRSTRGEHRLFRWRAGLPEQAVVKWRGVEFRIGGGDLGAQSAFPPAVNEHGQPREWLVSPDECDPVELPDFVVKVLRDAVRPPKVQATVSTPQRRPTNTLSTSVAEGTRQPTADENRRDATLFARSWRGAGEGDRNNCGFALACCLVRGFALNDSDALKLLQDWNARNSPPLPDDEVERLIVSAHAFKAGEPYGGRVCRRFILVPPDDAALAFAAAMEATGQRSAGAAPIEDHRIVQSISREPADRETTLRLSHNNLADFGGDWQLAATWLVEQLTYFCGPDHERIDRLMQTSPIHRPVWNESTADGSTLGQRLIDNAISKALAGKGFFQWPHMEG